MSGLCEEVPEDPPPDEPEDQVGDDADEAGWSGVRGSIREPEKTPKNAINKPDKC